MGAPGVDPLPSEQDQVRQFLMVLDRAQQGEYINLVLNNERSNIGAFPATDQDVIERANGFICGGGSRVALAPMACAGDVDKDVEGRKNLYVHIKFHTVIQCWDSPHVAITPSYYSRGHGFESDLRHKRLS